MQEVVEIINNSNSGSGGNTNDYDDIIEQREQETALLTDVDIAPIAAVTTSGTAITAAATAATAATAAVKPTLAAAATSTAATTAESATAIATISMATAATTAESVTAAVDDNHQVIVMNNCDVTNEPKPKTRFASALKRVRSYCDELTIEPILFGFHVAFRMSFVAEGDTFIRKACISNANYSEYLCENLRHFPEEQKVVQDIVSTFNIAEDYCAKLLMIFTSLFMCTWGDRYGYKIPLIIGLLGKCFYSLLFVLLSSINCSVYYILLATLVAGISGGDVMIFFAAYAYASKIKTDSVNNSKTTTAYAGTIFGLSMGALGAIVMNKLPANLVFAVNATIMCLVIIYTWQRIKFTRYETNMQCRSKREIMGMFIDCIRDSKDVIYMLIPKTWFGKLQPKSKYADDIVAVNNIYIDNDNYNHSHNNTSKKNIGTLDNIDLITDATMTTTATTITTTTVGKSKPYLRIFHIHGKEHYINSWCLLLSVFLFTFMREEGSYMNMFIRKYMNVSDLERTILLNLSTVSNVLFILIGLHLKFKPKYYFIVGMSAIVCILIGHLMYLTLYMDNLVAVFVIGTFLCSTKIILKNLLNSAVSTLIDGNHQGKMWYLISIFELFSGLVSSPIFSSFYRNDENIFLIGLVTIIMSVPPFFIIAVRYLHRKQPSAVETEFHFELQNLATREIRVDDCNNCNNCDICDNCNDGNDGNNPDNANMNDHDNCYIRRTNNDGIYNSGSGSSSRSRSSSSDGSSSKLALNAVIVTESELDLFNRIKANDNRRDIFDRLPPSYEEVSRSTNAAVAAAAAVAIKGSSNYKKWEKTASAATLLEAGTAAATDASDADASSSTIVTRAVIETKAPPSSLISIVSGERINKGSSSLLTMATMTAATTTSDPSLRRTSKSASLSIVQ